MGPPAGNASPLSADGEVTWRPEFPRPPDDLDPGGLAGRSNPWGISCPPSRTGRPPGEAAAPPQPAGWSPQRREQRNARCNFSTSKPHSNASGSKALGYIRTAAANRSACRHTFRSGGQDDFPDWLEAVRDLLDLGWEETATAMGVDPLQLLRWRGWRSVRLRSRGSFWTRT